MVRQAKIAEEAGFDGVTISEHHAGRRGYLPNPIQAVNWILSATTRIWAAPCPVVLPLRPAALVAEDVAWMAMRFPGRVGAGFAPGGATSDFDVAEAPLEERRRTFAHRLPHVAAALRGDAPAPLGHDAALAACKDAPVPCVSTVGGPVGARNGARAGVGIVPSSSEPVERARELVAEYVKHGGSGPIVLNRRVWLGRADPARIESLERTIQVSGSAAIPANTRHYQVDYISAINADDLAGRVGDVLSTVGAKALNIKFYYPGLGADEMRKQLKAFGEHVLPHLHPPQG